MGGLEKGRGFSLGAATDHLLGTGVLGDGLGALANGVLGQLSRQQEPHRRLDLAAADGGSLVVVSQTRSLGGDTFEDVVDEGVHDAHGLAGDAGVGVYLLQHLVDVDAEGLPPLSPPSPLLVSCGPGFASFLNGFSTGRHDNDATFLACQTAKNMCPLGPTRLYITTECKLVDCLDVTTDVVEIIATRLLLVRCMEPLNPVADYKLVGPALVVYSLFHSAV